MDRRDDISLVLIHPGERSYQCPPMEDMKRSIVWVLLRYIALCPGHFIVPGGAGGGGGGGGVASSQSLQSGSSFSCKSLILFQSLSSLCFYLQDTTLPYLISTMYTVIRFV